MDFLFIILILILIKRYSFRYMKLSIFIDVGKRSCRGFVYDS